MRGFLWGGLLFFAPVLAFAGALQDLRQFLDGARTLRAEFSQTVVGKSGRKPQQSNGVVSISRPGKLRWEVIKPYPQLMISDGARFWIYDPELAQVTVKKAGKAMSSTPAALLSGNNDLERNFTLRETGVSEDMAWVEAVPKQAESGFEKVRLGFSGGILKAMELYDSFGQVTSLRFSKLERNPPLPAELFRFTPPSGTDVVGE